MSDPKIDITDTAITIGTITGKAMLSLDKRAQRLHKEGKVTLGPAGMIVGSIIGAYIGSGVLGGIILGIIGAIAASIINRKKAAKKNQDEYIQ